MESLVATNIRKAIGQLNDKGASLDFRLDGLFPALVFYGSRHKIACAQSDYSGFYVLANAIRSVMRSVNFVAASRATLETRLFAPSVALSYTAAFHGLMAHLALGGRCYFEFFNWAEEQADDSLKSSDRPRDMSIVAAVLMRNNTWTFECRNRSHKARWHELLHLFAKPSYKIPRYYYELFDYMFAGRRKKLGTSSLVEYLQHPELRDSYKLKLEDAKEEFIDRIAEVRHLALYGAFGEDPNVVTALWNRDVTTSSGIECQAVSFYSFSEAMLDHVSSDLVGLLSVITPIASVRKALHVCVYLQWFDTPRTDEVPREAFESRVRWIQRWLNVDS